MKSAVQQGYGLSDEQMRGKGKDRPAPNSMARRRATSSKRSVSARTSGRAGHDCHRVHKALAQHTAQGHSVAVDGVRDPTEEAVIRAMGGQIWRMDNGKDPNPKWPMDRRQTSVSHDTTIDSSLGSKSEIRANVDKAMMALIRGSGLAKPTTKSE